MSEWQPIETAPKGEPKSYERGPRLLGASVGDWAVQISVIYWEWHKNPARGAWKGPHGVWEPTHWMPLPEPPAKEQQQ